MVGLEGRRVADACFVFLVWQRRKEPALEKVRLGITVSRKVGRAVIRNRVKRRVREWFRGARSGMRPGIDLVVIGRRAAAGCTARELEGSLRALARAAGAEAAA